MPAHATPVMPQFDCAGIGFCLHLSTCLQWHRIRIGQHFDTAHTIHGREAGLRQIESFREKRKQMFTLDQHRRANALIPARDISTARSAPCGTGTQ